MVAAAPDLDAALAIAKLNPACQEGGGVEVRPVAGGGFVQLPPERRQQALGSMGS
jgi:hypothetical protein